MNFNDYKQRLNANDVYTNGQRHSYEAQDIIEHTWYDDPAHMIAYFYDYDHDDEKDKNTNLHPECSKTKIPVEIKYMLSAYKSLNKDEVDLRIMFKPSYRCTIPYYKEKFEDITHSIFPTGLYCDIKDEKGIWNKWLVVATASLYNHDFPTWAILPCGYKFQWMHQGRKMEIWGVEQSQNSYNSGVWRDYKTESVENQTKAILPYNDISKTLFYNTRSIISVDLPQPITWRVTKVEGLAHKGNILFTFAQDTFDQHHDYIERDEDGKLIGMWADYFNEDNLPTDKTSDSQDQDTYAEITYAGAEPHIKVNGSYKKITITYYSTQSENPDQTPGVWSYFIDDTDVSDLIKELETDSPNSIKIKFLGDEEYLGRTLVVKNIRDNITAELQLFITSL